MSCQAEIKPLDTTVNSEVREDLTGPQIVRIIRPLAAGGPNLTTSLNMVLWTA